MDMNRILEMIDSEAKTTAGEVLVLTAGDNDTYRVVAVVRVCRDVNLREQADAYISSEAGRNFAEAKFVDYLVSEGAVERIKTRNLHVADDSECLLVTPRIDDVPASDSAGLPFEVTKEHYEQWFS